MTDEGFTIGYRYAICVVSHWSAARVNQRQDWVVSLSWSPVNNSDSIEPAYVFVDMAKLNLRETTDNARRDHESEVRDLHAKIGELTVVNDFLARGLKR